MCEETNDYEMENPTLFVPVSNSTQITSWHTIILNCSGIWKLVFHYVSDVYLQNDCGSKPNEMGLVRLYGAINIVF